MSKINCKRCEMPFCSATFTLDVTLNEDEYIHLQKGELREDVEERWFLYYENSKLYFHRMWTGNCIFIVEAKQQPNGCVLLHRVTVNQDPSQYRITDLEHCEQTVKKLIHISLVNMEKSNNADEQYANSAAL